MAEHLASSQPRHPDSGMDALIRHLETPAADTPEAVSEPQGPAGQDEEPLAAEGHEPEAEAEVESETQQVEGQEEFEEDPLVPIRINGVEEQVPLSELMRGYSRNADYTRKTQIVAEERRALEAERSQLMLAQREAVGRAAMLAQRLEAEIQANQPNVEELSHLRATNPGEYAARIADMQRQQQLLSNAQQQQAMYEQQQMGQRVEQERSLLSDKEPEFASDFDGTYAKLGQWVTSPDGGGVPVEDWNNEYDHRRILIAYRAMKASEQNAAAQDRDSVVRKKVANLPRVRPGARVEGGQTERVGYEAALSKMRDTDSTRDIAKALLARSALNNVRSQD